MTQEEKQLLLKDLCARLPYGVVVDVSRVEEWKQLTLTPFILSNYYDDIEKIRPYLRSMYSMTEDEKKAVCSMNMISDTELNNRLNYQRMYVQNYTIETFDLFNAHHLDYRGLIPMGLALEAPKDMYKTE